MSEGQAMLKTGTSTIGITFDGGVVVGADHRATMGHFIANKSVQKLFQIGENLALTTAGLVGHAQSLSRTLSAEVALFELKRQQHMTVRGAATLTANILVGRPHCYNSSSSVWMMKVHMSIRLTLQVVRFLMCTVLQVQDLRTCTVFLKMVFVKICPSRMP